MRPIFSRPCGTDRPFKSNPGLASWAKFSRPYGTKFGNGVLIYAHEACITNATAADSLAQRCDSALSRFLPSAVSW
jgi:hypothetical protein